MRPAPKRCGGPRALLVVEVDVRAAGNVTRPWGETGSARSESNPSVDMFGRPLWVESDKEIVDAVERIATDRGVSTS